MSPKAKGRVLGQGKVSQNLGSKAILVTLKPNLGLPGYQVSSITDVSSMEIGARGGIISCNHVVLLKDPHFPSPELLL